MLWAHLGQVGAGEHPEAPACPCTAAALTASSPDHHETFGHLLFPQGTPSRREHIVTSSKCVFAGRVSSNPLARLICSFQSILLSLQSAVGTLPLSVRAASPPLLVCRIEELPDPRRFGCSFAKVKRRHEKPVDLQHWGDLTLINLIIILSQNRLESKLHFKRTSDLQELLANGLDDKVVVGSFRMSHIPVSHVDFAHRVMPSGVCNCSSPYFMP